MYVDSHCHLEIEEFDDDRAKVIEESLSEGLIYILTVGTEVKYFGTVTDLVGRYDQLYGAVGIHPHNAKNWDDHALRQLSACLDHPKIVAVGEIGLDFFKNHSPVEQQIKAFEEQMELARKLRAPIIVHSRNSRKETLDLLREFSPRLPSGGVIHCFSYDLDTARELLDMGFYLSIPGTITYSRNAALVDVAGYIPLDRILVETDAPFLAPHPYRGKRNVPHFVKITTNAVASIRKMAVEDLSYNVRRNFERLFLKRDRKGKEE